MTKSAGNLARFALTLFVAAIMAACSAEGPVGAPIGQQGDAPTIPVSPNAEFRGPDLGTCSNLQVPAGSRLALRTYATGDQIHRWNGTSWTFVAPSASLYMTKLALVPIGTHGAGPFWELVGGSRVTGAVFDRCPVAPADIPWLILTVSSNADQGVLKGVTHILRVNTNGGVAPAAAGEFVGEERRVPYTAEYFFYRAP